MVWVLERESSIEITARNEHSLAKAEKPDSSRKIDAFPTKVERWPQTIVRQGLCIYRP